MRFDLVDRVLEASPQRIITLKCVTAAEEYLADHFPTFPVLPGVMMLEAMVQAARRLAGETGGATPLVLGRVRALKYGRFVRPGESIRVEVDLLKGEGESHEFKGQVLVADASGQATTAASGRFTLRPALLSG